MDDWMSEGRANCDIIIYLVWCHNNLKNDWVNQMAINKEYLVINCCLL